jgi:membrane protein required for colicin V production
MSSINGFDLFALIVFAVFVIASLWRGAMMELMGLLGWVAAFLLARLYAQDVGALFFASLEPAFLRTAVSWVAVFIAVLLAAHLLGSIFKTLFQKAGLSVVDRAIGGLLGFMKACVVVLALVWVAGYTPISKTELFKSSVAAQAGMQVIALVRQNNAFGEAEGSQQGSKQPTPAAAQGKSL